MENKNFKTVEEVAEYLENKYYDCYDEEDELKEIEVNGMEKFLPDDKYDIYYGFDRVIAIFATEDKIEYIWKTIDCRDLFKYEARVVDNEEIAKAIDDYPQYVRDGGCFDVSKWIFEYCDTMLSIDYDVMTTIGRIW